MSLLLILELEAQIKRRDDRIAELEELITEVQIAWEYLYKAAIGKEL